MATEKILLTWTIQKQVQVDLMDAEGPDGETGDVVEKAIQEADAVLRASLPDYTVDGPEVD